MGMEAVWTTRVDSSFKKHACEGEREGGLKRETRNVGSSMGYFPNWRDGAFLDADEKY